MVMPISVGLWVLADQAVIKIYGAAYASSILPLQILLVSLVFAFLDFPVGALLNASNRQNRQTLAMGVTMVVNILLNLLLLPRLGIVGASVAALAGNITLLLIGALSVPKVLSRLGTSFWFWLGKNVLAALLMGVAVNWLKQLLLLWLAPRGLFLSAIYFSILIIAGGVVYLAAIWLLRLISRADWLDLLSILKRQPALETKNG